MFIVGVCCFISTFFGFSTYIFYPAVEPLTQALHTTKSLINLTNVPFQVVAGLAPAIVGCTADFYGRRPVYNVSLILFTASNIGLALLTSYPALLGRRMLQIVGASGKFVLSNDVLLSINHGFRYNCSCLWCYCRRDSSGRSGSDYRIIECLVCLPESL